MIGIGVIESFLTGRGSLEGEPRSVNSVFVGAAML